MNQTKKITKRLLVEFFYRLGDEEDTAFVAN